ncbi:MAG: hypothetical protein WAK31_30690 [Chthoniobacterales bacterium]
MESIRILLSDAYPLLLGLHPLLRPHRLAQLLITDILIADY